MQLFYFFTLSLNNYQSIIEYLIEFAISPKNRDNDILFKEEYINITGAVPAASLSCLRLRVDG